MNLSRRIVARFAAIAPLVLMAVRQDGSAQHAPRRCHVADHSCEARCDAPLCRHHCAMVTYRDCAACVACRESA